MNHPLSREALENLFWRVTAEMMDLDPDPENEASVFAVRQSWAEDGSPDWNQNQDVCILRVQPLTTHPYNLRDTQVGEHIDDVRREFITDLSRVHEVSWILYGPNSWERAERIRYRLTLPEIKYKLGHENLFMSSAVPFISRVPEHIKSKWWERCDLRAHFYEAARYVDSVGTIAEADVRVTRESDS